MSEVARIAGISRQTIYRRIGGKEKFDKLIGKKRPVPDDATEKSRDRILTAAYKTIARFGYTAATIDRIAAEAGLTKGSVYWHFREQERTLPCDSGKTTGVSSQVNIRNMRILPSNRPDPLTGIATMLSNQISFAMFDPDWQKIYLSYVLQGQDKDITKAA